MCVTAWSSRPSTSRPPVSGELRWYSPINLALSGWEVSGIMTLATGFPFDVSYAGGSSNSLWCPVFTNFYACPDAPNQVAAITKANPRMPLTTQRSQPVPFQDRLCQRAHRPVRQHPPRPGPRPRHQQHQHDPGQELLLLVDRSRHPPAAAYGERQRLQPHAVRQPGHTWNDATLCNANSTFGYISGIDSGCSRLTQLATKIYF